MNGMGMDGWMGKDSAQKHESKERRGRGDVSTGRGIRRTGRGKTEKRERGWDGRNDFTHARTHARMHSLRMDLRLQI